MSSLFSVALTYLSQVCGLDSISAFPSGHPFARTRWNPAYFDIAYITGVGVN